jgi:hypothetical protein
MNPSRLAKGSGGAVVYKLREVGAQEFWYRAVPSHAYRHPSPPGTEAVLVRASGG